MTAKKGAEKKSKKKVKVSEETVVVVKEEVLVQETKENNIVEPLTNEVISPTVESVTDDNTNIIVNVNEETSDNFDNKKRGRKPKGGKIVQQLIANQNNKENKINIILHLKCSLKDLQNNQQSPLEYYNFVQDYNYSYETLKNDPVKNNVDLPKNSNPLEKGFYEIMNKVSPIIQEENEVINNGKEDKRGKQELWNKIKQLQHRLHMNHIDNKKSACFWCTCDFDNPPIYIPKHFIQNSYHVYGCFCTPECAVAHLMEENLDHSVKFERYHLLNHLYSKIYNYTKHIKPAPKPYYLLDKFYGNLSIQEYRTLLHTDRLFLVVDKPLTRILPELHEDNDDFIINHKMIPSSLTNGISGQGLSNTNNYLTKKKGLKNEKTNVQMAFGME
jgi:hypothetical protein